MQSTVNEDISLQARHGVHDTTEPFGSLAKHEDVFRRVGVGLMRLVHRFEGAPRACPEMVANKIQRDPPHQGPDVGGRRSSTPQETDEGVLNDILAHRGVTHPALYETK